MVLLFMIRKQQKFTGAVLTQYYGNVTGVNIQNSRPYMNPEYAGKLRYTGHIHGQTRVHYFIVTILYQKLRPAIMSH
jgi:hypothetical protein